MNKNIVLIGMPGCGKTTIGKILSRKLNMDFYDVDKYIEQKTTKTIPELFAIGESHFRDVEEECVREVSKKTKRVISTGGGVVLRENNILNLKRNGIIIFINRPLENIIGDVDTTTRPLLKDGVERLKKLYEDRIDLYKGYCDFDIKNDKSLASVVEDIIKIIGVGGEL